MLITDQEWKENKEKEKVLYWIISKMEIEFKYYSLKLSNKLKEESYIEFIQENSIEFLVPSIYLIYAWLMVYAKLYLTYFKDYILFIRLTYSNYAI